MGLESGALGEECGVVWCECNTPNLSSLKLGNSPEEWGILPYSRLRERISPKREDQCFEFGNDGVSPKRGMGRLSERNPGQAVIRIV
ncbi:hypothetical protein Lal_00033584 [Lupinus albus]|nr:hypothetical protein Lal_00033584 [Lupinus albus]